MIEPTDEMIEAIRAATGCKTRTCHSCTVKATNAAVAVLAIVKREYGMVGPCSSVLPDFGDREFGTSCELRHGHSGDHEAGPTRWRERS